MGSIRRFFRSSVVLLNIDPDALLQRISLDLAEKLNYPQLPNEAAVEPALGDPHQSGDRYYDEEHQRLRM